VKLLVDNQLPIALARYLEANNFECEHVQDVGLDAADDQTIWQYAIANQSVIVTKDEDFQLLATRQALARPQVVWVRIGNCRKVALLAAFASVLPAMRDLLAAGEAVIEIR
jgi:predicted nuclease of predicted toxin-antitoxin system